MIPSLLLTSVLLAAAPAAAQDDRASEDILRAHLWSATTALEAGTRPRVALALSGGGARGFAHLGFYEVLEREGFPVDAIAGTSIGAVLGAGFANGYTAAEMRRVIAGFPLGRLVAIKKTAFLRLLFTDEMASSAKMDLIFEKMYGGMRFHDLEIPFACTAMDIKTGETIVFRTGPLGPAVRASMNLPGIFRPKAYRHRLLVDGGVTAYVPTQVARRLGGDWVLAHVTMGDYTASDLSDVFRQFEQVIDIRGHVIARRLMEEADAVIEAPVQDLSGYDFSSGAAAYLRGLEGAHRKIGDIKDRYTLFSLPRLAASWRSEP